MNPHAQDTYTQTYNKWVQNPSPENMAELVSVFMPTINSELQQYAGSKSLLRARAKAYVISAIRSFNPMGKTKLNSWIVTNLKQLSRYGKRLRTIRASEETIRNSAELHKVKAELEDKLGRAPTDEELQDETGWSLKELARIQAASTATVTSELHTNTNEEGGPEEPGSDTLNQLPFIRDAIYMSLGDRDRQIYDYRLGAHGKPKLQGQEIAKQLNVTPAFISQRAAHIGSMFSELGG